MSAALTWTARKTRAALPTALAAGAAASVALAGCSSVDAVLSKQVAVVDFHANTTVSTLLQIRATCSHVPHVRLLPAPTSGPAGAVNAAYVVRYEITHASATDLAALRTCLEQFSSVAGVAIQDAATPH